MTPKRAPRPKARRRVSSNGGVDYALGQIDSSLTMVQQILSEDRLSSAQYRTHIREVLDNLQAKSAHLEGQMDHMAATLNELKDNMKSMDERVEKLEAHNIKIVNDRVGFNRAMSLVAKSGYIIAGAAGSAIAMIADRYLKGGIGPHP